MQNYVAIEGLNHQRCQKKWLISEKLTKMRYILGIVVGIEYCKNEKIVKNILNYNM